MSFMNPVAEKTYFYVCYGPKQEIPAPWLQRKESLYMHFRPERSVAALFQ